jgi:hypothetical protein
MESKKIYTIIGILAGAGLIYYFWKKSKSSDVEESKEEVKEDAPKKAEGKILRIEKDFSTPLNLELEEKKPVVQEKPKVKQLTSAELDLKLQQCGKKPLLKKNKKKYEECRENLKSKLRSEGYISFSGEQESIVPNTFYSSFDSNLDLDLDL